MRRFALKPRLFLLIAAFCLPAAARNQAKATNQVLGQVNFVAVNKPAKTAGVWIDSEYVGYLNELKGSRQILLLPGRYQIEVKQNGYLDFQRSLLIDPGQRVTISVALQKNPRAQYPVTYSQLKLSVDPDRAAVFVDHRFVGHAGEFGGIGRGMLLAPGKHQIEIDLPGYQNFSTTINLLPRQKMVLKTKLVKGTIDQANSLIYHAKR